MYKTIIEMLKALEETNDVCYNVINTNTMRITFNNFGGFDADWCEIDREYKNAKGVDDLLNYLSKNAITKNDNGCYDIYYFREFNIEVTYTSYDI